MHLVVVGVNHKTAPLEIRERLAIDDRGVSEALSKLKGHAHTGEFCVVSTCNRTELYAVAPTRVGDDMLISFVAGYSGIRREDLDPCVYVRSGHHAIKHLFEVACGLDSMAVGETQILGQIRNAYCIADEAESTGTILNTLFQRAIAVGKRARTETGISCGAFSIGAAAVQLAKTVFGSLEGRRALLVGAGDMSKLAATHLAANGVEKTYVVSRTRSRADALLANIPGESIEFGQIESVMREVDFLISSTSAPRPVITKERMSRVMKARGCSPLFLIDIAVPRDLDPEIDRVRNAYLYDIDDLQQVVEHNRHEREREAQLAERIVEQELANVNDWLRGLEVVPTIATLREAVEEIRRGELARLGNRLSGLTDEQRAQVEMLTTSIVNKILHVPTVKMKEVAGRDQCYLYVDAVRTLFDLDGHAGDDGDTPAGDAGRATADHTDRAAAEDAPSGGTVHHLRGTGTEDA